MGTALAWLERKRPGWRVELAAAVGVGLFLGLTGPFGSYLTAPWWQRAAWWTAALIAGTLVFGTIARAVIGRGMSLARTFATLLFFGAVAAAPFALLVAVAASTVWPKLASLGALEWYAQVLAIALPLLLLAALGAWWRRRRVRPARAAPPSASGETFLGADPREIVCLSMEDHYVRVHTDGGSHLVLATLQQAIAAFGSVPGLQVHRSWWVADKAVDGAVSEGRNLRLRLTGGVTAPVARSSVAAVRSAGWLARREPDRRAR